MTYMIYIYLGVAFVLAGGGWFIGWHGGYRRGKREGYRLGYQVADATNAASLVRFKLRPELRTASLSDQIHAHLEIMDRDDDWCAECDAWGDHRTGEHAS